MSNIKMSGYIGSTGTLEGYSYFQDELLSFVEHSIENIEIFKDNVVSTISNGVLSLQYAEDSLNSEFTSTQDFNLALNSTKISTDLDIYNQISTLNGYCNSNVSNLVAFNTSALGVIDSLNNVFDSSVSSFSNTNTNITNNITSIKNYFDSVEIDKNAINIQLSSQLESYKEYFDSRIPLLEDKDANMLTLHSNQDSISRYEISLLQKIDSAFINTDSGFAVDLSILESKMNSKFPIVERVQSDFISKIDSNNVIVNNTFSELNNNDLNLNSMFDSMTNFTDNQIISLYNFDTSLNSSIISIKTEVDNAFFDLNSVNSFLDRKLSTFISNFDTNNNNFEYEDGNLNNLISTNDSIFEYTASLLSIKDFDNNSIIDSINSVKNDNLSILISNDSLISNLISTNFMEFTGVKNFFLDADSNFEHIQSSNTQFFDIRIDSINSTNDIQSNFLSNIDSNVNSINYDITNRINTEIASKQDQSTFDYIVTSLTDENTSVFAVLASQVTNVAQSQIDSTQWSQINDKKDQTEYDDKMADLDAINQNSDIRIRMIEECFRTILLTYGADKPDNTPYEYTGKLQNLINAEDLPALFEIVGKRKVSTTAWGFDIRLTPYGYNTFLNKLAIVPPTGVSGAFTETDVLKNQFNPITLTYTFSVPNSRDLEDYTLPDFPFTVQYKNLKDETLYYVEITSANFSTMSDVTPINVTYPAQSFTFNVNNAITPIAPTIDNICGPNIVFSIDSDNIYPALPTDLSINSNTGVISGTPNSSVSQTTYRILISNAVYNVYRYVTFSVI